MKTTKAGKEQKTKIGIKGLPGSSVVKNLPANAGDPWSRRTPHATEQLSLCATAMSLCCRAREPQLLNLCTSTA